MRHTHKRRADDSQIYGKIGVKLSGGGMKQFKIYSFIDRNYQNCYSCMVVLNGEPEGENLFYE